ncbi:Protein kinase domain-containing protein [Mycena kentingensis (nom. inval.)]|nr:Protein kinase domain-containing protein [Mycena kentingensis (nom. inval.)]
MSTSESDSTATSGSTTPTTPLKAPKISSPLNPSRPPANSLPPGPPPTLPSPPAVGRPRGQSMSAKASGQGSPRSLSPLRSGTGHGQRTPPTSGASTTSFGMALEVKSPSSVSSDSRSRLDLPPESPTSTSRSRSRSPAAHDRLLASELLEHPPTPPNAPPSSWWGQKLRKERPWREPTSPVSSTHSSPTTSPKIAPTIPKALREHEATGGLAGQAAGRRSKASDDWDDEHSTLFGAPLRRKQTVPKEQTQGWERTRERVALALQELLPTALLITHDVLEMGHELLEFVPIPGLELAAKLLLNIWDQVQLVDMSRLACLRLAERSANLLISVVQEVRSMGNKVEEDMKDALEKLIETFTQVRDLLIKQAHRPFLKRYLRREETVRDIAGCDTAITDALAMFSISVQMRTYRQVVSQEARREAENRALLEAIERLQQRNTLGLGIGDSSQQLTPRPKIAELPIPDDEIIATLQNIQSTQNTLDFAHDTADLRGLLREALAQSSDVEMLRILQVGRAEMPEALKTLQRALERVGVSPATPVAPPAPPIPLPPEYTARGATIQRSGTLESSSDSSSSGSGGLGMVRDTLDREFIEGGIDALRRMSKGGPMLPSWTITRYEVDRDVKIGIGFFSDVYKGTWRGRTVAIKCLVETTPRDLFLREVNIWKELKHPNVLDLYGASGASGDGPWFFVCPYMRFGSLSTFLRRVAQQQPVETAREGREGDLLRFMHEVAKGMEYLHGRGVLHGDLKAANVLVDDRIHCLVCDFGQSEMKSEAYRISGNVPPHGTLRWQAPELMLGSNELTPAMDVYAFAICCIEILLMGRLPWPLMSDEAVRNFVLRDKTRPQIPASRYTTPALETLLRACWNEDPSARPAFSRIVKEAKQLRRDAELPFTGFGDDLASPPTSPMRPDWQDYEGAGSRPSPDMHPVPLPKTPPMDVPVPFPAHGHGPSPEPSSIDSYHTSMSHGQSPPSGEHFIAHREDTVSSSGTAVPEPVVYSTTSSSRTSSIFTPSTKSSSVDDLRDLLLGDSGYDSPAPMDERVAEIRNERRYRMLLVHEFHPSLTLALWHPTPIALGAVGFLHKPSGNFITLFNCFHPERTTGLTGYTLPSVYGYGRVSTGNQRQDKRTAAQRGLDAIAGLLTFSGGKTGKDGGITQNVTRRYTFPLRSGHKVAYLCTETTVYKYMDNLDAPKKWFRANIDTIMQQYGALHEISKEDVYLVIGTLDTPDYGLFVSHNHPDGQAHFNVYSSPKTAQPWGTFTTDAEPEQGGPSYHEPIHGTPLSASKVSKTGSSWDTVLVARLRFKPDVLEPTSL